MLKHVEDLYLTLPANGAYIIQYEDASMEDERFVGEGAKEVALRRLEQISDSWNAHLYVKVCTNTAKHTDYVEDATPRERSESEKFVEDQNDSLAAKGELLLTVELKTRAEANELMQWMYGSDKPMSSKLISITWDHKPIPKPQWEALQNLIQSSPR